MSSTNEHMPAVAARILEARTRLGRTQPQMATAMGLSLRAYQNYERGVRAPSDELIRAAWSTFGIDPVWLLTGEGAMYREVPGEERSQAEGTGLTSAAIPSELAAEERRVSALLDVLAQLDPGSRDAILSDCFARAATAQQLADLRQAVTALAADRGRKAS